MQQLALLTFLDNFPPDVAETHENTTTEETKAGKVFHHCVYQLHKRVGKITVTASFQITEVATGIVKVTDKVEDVETDQTSWVTFSGDQAAIPYEIMQQNQGERALQTPQEMASTAVNKIGAALAQKLLNHF